MATYGCPVELRGVIFPSGAVPRLHRHGTGGSGSDRRGIRYSADFHRGKVSVLELLSFEKGMIFLRMKLFIHFFVCLLVPRVILLIRYGSQLARF